jgi:uncharacterized protein
MNPAMMRARSLDKRIGQEPCMYSPEERLRSTGLVLFSSKDVFTLFSPETLQLFLLNARTAEVMADVLGGASIRDAALTHNLLEADLLRVTSTLVDSVERTPNAYPETGSTLHPNKALPKLVLMVNNYCNLKCTYCYEHGTVFKQVGRGMSEEIARTALERFTSAFSEIGTIMFIGGEPTLNSEVIDFACEHATNLAIQRNQPPPSFSMVTNGVKMTDEVFATIAKYQIQTTFSIDGPKKVNDLIRIRHDNSGTFDAVVSNMKRYEALLPDKLGVECTVTAAHQASGMTIKDLVEFARDELHVLHPHITAAGMPSGNPLDPYRHAENLSREFEEAAEQGVNSWLNGMKAEGRYTPIDGSLDSVSFMLEAILKREGSLAMCPAGTAQLVVDAHGDVYPCWMFAGMKEFQMGNVLHDEVFNSSAAKTFERVNKNTKKNNPQCAACYARHVCSACIGNNQNSTGAIETINENFCNTVRHSLRTVVLTLGKAKQQPAEWNALVAAAKDRRNASAAPQLH